METQPLAKLYEKVWSVPEYRNFSPGETAVKFFLKEVRPPKDSSIAFFGCGCGREAVFCHRLGYEVVPIDFAPNCLDDQARHEIGHKFVEGDLTDKYTVETITDYRGGDAPAVDYGFCCDVMEHLEEDKVAQTIDNIMMLVPTCVFQICLVEDHFGKHEDINHPLHLTVKPYVWWRDLFREKYNVADARDLNTYGWFKVQQWSVDQGTLEWEDFNAKDVG